MEEGPQSPCFCLKPLRFVDRHRFSEVVSQLDVLHSEASPLFEGDSWDLLHHLSIDVLHSLDLGSNRGGHVLHKHAKEVYDHEQNPLDNHEDPELRGNVERPEGLGGEHHDDGIGDHCCIRDYFEHGLPCSDILSAWRVHKRKGVMRCVIR